MKFIIDQLSCNQSFLLYCWLSSLDEVVGIKLNVVSLPDGVVKYCKQPFGGLKMKSLKKFRFKWNNFRGKRVSMNFLLVVLILHSQFKREKYSSIKNSLWTLHNVVPWTEAGLKNHLFVKLKIFQILIELLIFTRGISS